MLARLQAGGSLGFYGASLTAESKSAVFLGASADMLFVACLSGNIATDRLNATPGQMLVWALGAPEPEKLSFDVARFLASTTLSLESDPKLYVE